jgi:hypothetical protein
MKKFQNSLALLLVAISTISLPAQFVSRGYNKEEFQRFLTTKKTYVLKTDMEEIDDLIADALTKYWKVTPYEVISKEEMFEKLYDPSYSFLLPAAFSITLTYGSTSSSYTNFVQRCSNKKPTDIRHKDDPKYQRGLHDLQRGMDGFLAVVLGGEFKYDMGDMVAFAPFEVEPGYSAGTTSLYNGLFHQRYRITDMVAGLHRSIELVRDNKYEYGPDNSLKFFFDNVYNKDAGLIKNKTLYLLDSDFAKTPDLKKVYPYDYKLVDFEEYMTAIREEKEGIIYLLVSRNAPSALYLVDPHEHKIVGGRTIRWSDSRIENQTIDAGDVKKIADLIESTSSK